MKKTEKKKEPIKYDELLKSAEKPLVAEESAIVYEAMRYSYADYLTWTDGAMREIIDGVIYAFSAPLLSHAIAVRTFLARTFNFIKKNKVKWQIFTAPFDVRLPKNGDPTDHKIFDVVQPDIVVVCDPSKLDERGCIGAPDLIVEVNSPTTSKRDLNLKFSLYEKAGVKEYWVVFPKDEAVTVFILQKNGKYDDDGKTYQVLYGDTHVPVQTLEGLVIDLKELFED